MRPAGCFLRRLFCFLPTGIRIVVLHRFANSLRLLTQIFLIHHALLPHDEGHHARRPVLRRIGHKRETARHLPVHPVILGSARGIFSLPRQDVVVVSAVRSRRSRLAFSVSLSHRRRHQRPDRTRRFPRACFPVKPVVLPLIAEDLRRVLTVLRRVIFFLRCHQLLAYPDRRHFIPPHPPEQNFLLARFRVEIPRIPFTH